MKRITSTYDACAIIEQFADTQSSWRDEIRAWAYLIRTGAAWQLQGWYGRNAQQLLDYGYISKAGRVQWAHIDNTVQRAYEAAKAK